MANMANLSLKRKAEDELQNEQRLTKKFDLLNLDHTGKLYVPVHNPKTQTPTKYTPNTNGESDFMHLDDTKDRVYIHNLDDELSDIESEEGRLVFLPDIEKKLGKLPRSVLLGEGHPAVGNEMILYSVPTSLTVPEEQDNVKRAIIESRARAREKQVRDAQVERQSARVDGTGEADGGVEEQKGLMNLERVAVDQVESIEPDEDEDAMDIG